MNNINQQVKQVNASLLYYILYDRNEELKIVKDIKQEKNFEKYSLSNVSLTDESYFKVSVRKDKYSNENDWFELTTVYPGFFTGSGYAHTPMKKPDTEKEKADYQLGFFFDHTTGMPLITGSSVKGILKRSELGICFY